MTPAKTTSMRAALMVTTTLCGSALTGLALPLAAALLIAPATAEAQDYTSGALIGSVRNAAGQPVAGATITLTSQAQGQSRTLTSSASGTFSTTGLAPGEYDIIVRAGGYDEYKSTVTVVISQEVRVEASLHETGATQTVVVKGKRVRQDFTKTTTGLTVDVDSLVAQQPIARNLTAVTMLAPTVVMGNPSFANGNAGAATGKQDYSVASFGGGSVAENAYYVDGLNITNPDTYVGSAAIPFDFYKTIEVKTAA